MKESVIDVGRRVRIDVDPATLALIDVQIAREHELGRFRPEVAAVVESVMPDRPSGDFLLTRRNYWAFPKGGVEKGETAIGGLFRELGEETGIEADSTIIVCSYLYKGRVGAHNWPLNGFSDGAECFFFHLQCLRRPEIKLNLDEACDYRWLPPQQAIDLIESIGEEHREKRNSMLFALRRALNSRRSR